MLSQLVKSAILLMAINLATGCGGGPGNQCEDPLYRDCKGQILLTCRLGELVETDCEDLCLRIPGYTYGTCYTDPDTGQPACWCE